MTDDWRPSCSVDTAVRRATMLAAARRFFAGRRILEVDTPALSRAAVSDPHIESVEARLRLAPRSAWYLRTSPEFCMKRLLAAGFPDVYEICKVFRDNEAGPAHQPEFTLVEWYRLGFGLKDIVNDTVDFIGALIEPRHLARPPLTIDYRDAFRQFAVVDPLTAPLAELARVSGADERLTAALGERRDGWLDFVLSSRVVPHFDGDRLTVLRHYPESQAALARLCPDDPSVADRFEVFLGARELANGYVELRDSAEQEERMQSDQEIRRRDAQILRPLDHRLLASLRSGLPACAGVAVGFERLLMINEMTDDIRQVQAFAFDEDEVAGFI